MPFLNTCVSCSVVSDFVTPWTGSSVHGIIQARIPEWVASSFSRGSSSSGIEPGSPALQADSSLSEPPGKPESVITTHKSPSILSLPSCSHPTLIGHHRVPGWAPCVTPQPPTSHLFYTRQCIYVSVTFSVPPTVSFSCCGTILFSTSACLLLPCKQVHQCCFSRFHIYVLIYNICFSLTYFTLCNRVYNYFSCNGVNNDAQFFP